MWGHLLKLHAKTTPSYIRDLSIHGFWYLQVQGSWIQSPKDTEEGGRCLLRTSAAPPALDAVSSTAAQLLTRFWSTVSLPGFPNHDVRNHHPPPTHMPYSPPKLLGCCIFVSRTTCGICQRYMSAA